MFLKAVIITLMVLSLTVNLRGYEVLYDSFPSCSGIMMDDYFSIVGEVVDIEGGTMDDGTFQIISSFLLLTTEMTIDIIKEEIPLISTVLHQNYPNPFNPETKISFYLPQDTEKLDLKIFNIRGQLVRTLVEGEPHFRGEYQVTWDGRNDSGRPVTSGVYFYRMTTPSFDQVNKMLLLK
jgi:flagellar hook assembly protein FlgD